MNCWKANDVCYHKAVIRIEIYSEIINGKEYRYVSIRGRGKLIASDGDAINPIKRSQKATVHINPDGYPCFGGGVPVHLYVAYGWVDGWFEGAEVDHINYDRMDYNYKNLRWVTHSSNVDHSHGDENHYVGKHCGDKNGRAVLDESTVQKAKELFDKGMRTSDVIKACEPRLNAKDRKSVWNRYNRIKTGETWNQ